MWGTIQGGFIGVPRPTQFRIDITLPDDGEYHLMLRGAAASNNVIMTSRLLSEPRYLTLHSDPSNLSFYDKAQVFATRRQPLDISQFTQPELDRLIPASIVIINSQYQYFDLGTVTGKKGTYTLYFNKTDNTPLLVEGIVILPEDEFDTLSLPENVQLLEPDALCCGPLIHQSPQVP